MTPGGRSAPAAGDPVGALIVGPALLASGARGGPLAGCSFVAKDLFDVAGQRTGAGNPAWAEDAPVATSHAPAVDRLLAAGADLIGKAVTDELAFSLAGSNVHHGTPVNVKAPGRVPGGSSSGSAVAVAAGLCDLALGTDTAGSVRVPASYCGVWGLRPTWGAASLDGVVPLSPSYDTPGVLAATGHLLAAGGRALLDAGDGAGGADVPSGLVVAEDLLAVADTEAADAVRAGAGVLGGRLGATVRTAFLAPDPEAIDRWHDAFVVQMLFEAWATHGEWITTRRPPMGPGIARRFAFSAALDDPGPAAAVAAEEVRAALAAALGPGDVLVLPSAAGPAPPIDLDQAAREDVQSRTLHLTGVASLAGAPAASLPLATVDGLPVGVGVLARPGEDATLLAVAAAAGP